MTALSITRTDLTVEQLRQAATRESDPKAVRRILAIAMVLDVAWRIRVVPISSREQASTEPGR